MGEWVEIGCWKILENLLTGLSIPSFSMIWLSLVFLLLARELCFEPFLRLEDLSRDLEEFFDFLDFGELLDPFYNICSLFWAFLNLALALMESIRFYKACVLKLSSNSSIFCNFFQKSLIFNIG